MGAWDEYMNVINNKGGNIRTHTKNNEIRMLRRKMENSLSYHKVLMDGISQGVIILNSDNRPEKTVISMPEENIKAGSVMEWSGAHWMIVEKDFNNELYTITLAKQCNYLLKWIDKFGFIHEQWSIIEDGTKYLLGEFEDRNFVVTKGDSRVMMTVPRNGYTSQLNRDSRFILDDPLSDRKLAYELTKPLKVGRVYEGEGVFSFILHESVITKDDNIELGIADYYKYSTGITQIPQDTNTVIDPENKDVETGKEVWI